MSANSRREKNRKGLKHVMNFGKYKGWTVEDLVIVNPSYLLWADENVSWFKLKWQVVEKAMEELTDQLLRRETHRFIRENYSYHYYDDDVFDEPF